MSEIPEDYVYPEGFVTIEGKIFYVIKN